jgi:hypothetical protein
MMNLDRIACFLWFAYMLGHKDGEESERTLCHVVSDIRVPTNIEEDEWLALDDDEKAPFRLLAQASAR